MDFTWQFLNMLLMLVIVCVGAIVLLKFFLPRYLGQKRWNKNNQFEMVSRFPLDVKRALYVVRIGKRYCVLAGSEHGFTKVTDLSEEEAREFHAPTN